jgi:hypothetical protein
MYNKAEHRPEPSGGDMSQKPEVVNKDKSLWWVGGFLLGLIILAAVLAII